MQKSIIQKSESSFNREQKSSEFGNTKIRNERQEERKNLYKIQFTDDLMNSRNLNDEELEHFKQKNYHLFQVLANPDLLTKNAKLATKVNQETWQTVAQQLLNAVCKIKEAGIFAAPVDVQRLAIPDYLDIIKKPMDFGTIKVK